MKKEIVLFLILFIASISLVVAEENITENSTSEDITIIANSTNGVDSMDDLANNETIDVVGKIENFTLLEIFPKTLTIGKAQLNLLVQNTGTKELKNLGAFLSGDSILVSDIRPIEILKPQEQDYILVWIETRKTGDIKLT